MHASGSSSDLSANPVASCAPEHRLLQRTGSKKSSLHCTFDTSDDTCDEDATDEFMHQPGKKRRLTLEQVKSLERNFELDNKLEPERKIQIAAELGLQPRQVAVWFQNRRARWKTKQLEKDYNALKTEYDSLKARHNTLVQEKGKLYAQMMGMKDKLRSIQSRTKVQINEAEGNKQEINQTCVFHSPRGDPGAGDRASILHSNKEASTDQSSLLERGCSNCALADGSEKTNFNTQGNRYLRNIKQVISKANSNTEYILAGHPHHISETVMRQAHDSPATDLVVKVEADHGMIYEERCHAVAEADEEEDEDIAWWDWGY